MPFLAALAPVFAALGASAATATALSVGLISSLIEMGANLAIGAISKLFKHASSVSGGAGSQLAVREPISYRRVIYGGVRVSGIITDMALSGPNNQYLHLIITIAGHEVATLGTGFAGGGGRTIYIDGVAVPLEHEPNGWHPVVGNKYRAHMCVEFELGDPTFSGQPFPTFNSDISAHWTANHKQRGCAKVHLRMVWDATLFPSGIPSSIAFDVQGKKVYDPRTATTVYSNNPALCVRDFLTDTKFGLGVDPATIDDASVIAAANICEEAVSLKAGGTQQRYTCDGVFDASVPRGSAINALLASMSGWVNTPGDMWRIFAGAYTDPVMTLTDSDLRGPIKYDTRVSRRNLANAVGGTFEGPLNNWQPSNFPPYESATYLAEDGGDFISSDIVLDFTTDPIRAQRLAKIHLEKLRRQNQIVLPCGLAAYPLEPGDVIEYSHARFGFVNKTFIITNTSLEVQNAQGQIVLGVNLTCTAIDSGVYAWTPSSDEGTFTPPAATTLPEIGTVGAPTGLTLTNVEVTRADGLRVLQIKASWTPPADAQVLNGGKINVWIRDRIRQLSVATTSRPWEAVASGINGSYLYDDSAAGSAPIAIPVTAGESIKLTWLSGTGVYGSGATPCDANGAGNVIGGVHVFPSSFIGGGTVSVLELLGTFVDALGNIITSEIHRVGDGPTTLTAPSGATQLLLGVDDIFFSDNTGAYLLSVEGGDGDWRLAGVADGADTAFYIPGVTDGSKYDVKIVAANSYGSLSAGDEVDNFTATATTATFVGSITSITQITDTNIVAPANGDTLKYDTASGKWINVATGATGDIAPIIPLPAMTSDPGGTWNAATFPSGLTLYLKVSGRKITQGCNTFKIALTVAAANLNISAAKIRKTPIDSTVWSDAGTAITWGSSATPSFTSTGEKLSDAIAYAIKPGFDYYIMVDINVGTTTGRGNWMTVFDDPFHAIAADFASDGVHTSSAASASGFTGTAHLFFSRFEADS